MEDACVVPVAVLRRFLLLSLFMAAATIVGCAADGGSWLPGSASHVPQQWEPEIEQADHRIVD